MPRQRVSAKTVSISSPIGGWNARDPLAEMPQEDAPSIINFWPEPTDLRLRLGWAASCTGFPNQNPVNTVATFNGATGSKLFAAQTSRMFDATGTTAVDQGINLGSDKLQYINNSTSGGNFLVMVNGADNPWIYNGTSWIRSASFLTGQTITSITVSGLTATLTTTTPHGLLPNNQITITGATPAQLNGAWIVATTPTSTTITFTVSAGAGTATVVGSYSVTGYTGVNPSTLNNINLFKNRQWFTPTQGTTVYYGDVSAVSGNLSPFPLGSVFRRGGTVLGCATWTIDAGTGVDDQLVFVTDQGEVAVYKGTDPTNANAWSLVGLWQLGAAFANRFHTKYGGDVLLMLHDGLVPLASALQSSRLDPRVNVTDKIYKAISDATTNYSTSFGWQVIYFPLANMLIINVPVSTGIEQYAMNTISKAWTRFQGIQAYNFTIYKDYLYFGGDGVVGRFWSAPSDNRQNINASIQQAYSYFNSRGQLKRFTLARPIFLVDAGPNSGVQGSKPGVVMGINYDFAAQNNLAPATFAPPLAAIGLWDLSRWNSGAVWGSGLLEVSKEWQGVNGIGYAAGIAMNVASQGIDIRWTATDLVFEPGGVL